ncbi:E3 ubiquitin-protein ligase BRE1-like 2 isoform X2 [Henckelia pumila]|uniref:E3 ubiquitin-protein ligase BRE1-like 2 isoform X2 n=1 Tax=Henckelia pumila TaxID=405737 RepID=UPI003C6E56B0
MKGSQNTIFGELEESMAKLEESRRKIINLKIPKDGVSGMQVSIPIPIHVPVLVLVPNAVNGTMSPEMHSDMSKRLCELKGSVEEIKVVTEDCFSELQDVQEDDLILSKQFHDLHVAKHSFFPYRSKYGL